MLKFKNEDEANIKENKITYNKDYGNVTNKTVFSFEYDLMDLDAINA